MKILYVNKNNQVQSISFGEDNTILINEPHIIFSVMDENNKIIDFDDSYIFQQLTEYECYLIQKELNFDKICLNMFNKSQRVLDLEMENNLPSLNEGYGEAVVYLNGEANHPEYPKIHLIDVHGYFDNGGGSEMIIREYTLVDQLGLKKLIIPEGHFDTLEYLTVKYYLDGLQEDMNEISTLEEYNTDGVSGTLQDAMDDNSVYITIVGDR